MKVLVYSYKSFEQALKYTLADGIDADYTTLCLDALSARKAKGYDAVCLFVGDDASAPVLETLAAGGVRFIVTRSAGYDHIDISAAHTLGLRVCNIGGYSPHAVAEHAVALMLALDRKLIRANQQVHQHNFTVDKLVGFNLYGKKAGIVGMGRIGSTVASILHGFGCTILAHDVAPNEEMIEKYDVHYTGLYTLCSICDIITLHVPLNKDTRGMVDRKLLYAMLPGVMLINTARGAIVDTYALLTALKSGRVGSYGADVYENEKGVFLYDHSAKPVQDPLLQSLLQMKQVLLTPHQGFATVEALKEIAAHTIQNLLAFSKGQNPPNEILPRSSYAPNLQSNK